MAKKILIVYSTAGAGHKKAAFAIKKAFDEMGAGQNVDIVDALDHTSRFFKWTYPRIYIFMVNRIPYFWGIGYYLLDNRFVYSATSWIRHATNWINARPLARYLRQKDYDVIISTHFLPTDIISMEGKDKTRARLINVVTDFRMHSFWYASATDVYVVAHKLAREELVSRYRVSEEKIKVLGIPIDTVFSRSKGREELIDRLGLEKDLFTVLVGSGGFGVGPIAELVQAFNGIDIPMQLVIICGKNKPLLSTITNMKDTMSIPLKAFGFVDNMDEFMAASDIMISKTGGLMSSEALSKSLPIIGIAPIPGQETRNFDILKKSCAIIDGRDIAKIPKIVTNLYKNEDMMKTLKENIEAIKRPEAAKDIAELALSDL